MEKKIEIDGDIAYVQLTRGKVTVIDASSAALVGQHKWHAIPSSTGAFYARSGVAGYLHRFLTDAPAGKDVDHINHDPLDNRLCNLRVGSHKENMKNGKFALATHCPAGHPYDEANTYRDKRGRRCRACNRLRVAAIYAAETPEQRERRLAYKREHTKMTRLRAVGA